MNIFPQVGETNLTDIIARRAIDQHTQFAQWQLTPNICPFAVNAAPRTLWWNEGAPTPLVPVLASHHRTAGEGPTKTTNFFSKI
jgi:hypothetical protein